MIRVVGISYSGKLFGGNAGQRSANNHKNRSIVGKRKG